MKRLSMVFVLILCFSCQGKKVKRRHVNYKRMPIKKKIVIEDRREKFKMCSRLMVAAKAGDIEAAEDHFKNGAIVDCEYGRNNGRPITVAIINKQYEFMAYLVNEKLADLGFELTDRHGNFSYTPLMLAIIKTDLKMVKILLDSESGLNINYETTLNGTALSIIPIGWRTSGIIEMLKRYGAEEY